MPCAERNNPSGKKYNIFIQLLKKFSVGTAGHRLIIIITKKIAELSLRKYFSFSFKNESICLIAKYIK